MDCRHEHGHDHVKNLAKRSEQLPRRSEQTVAYQKGGRLDWDTNQFKLEAVVTRHGASAPAPIQLTTDALFSAPILGMGRRRVA